MINVTEAHTSYSSKAAANLGIKRFKDRVGASGVVFTPTKAQDGRFEVRAFITPMAPNNAPAICEKAGFVVVYSEIEVVNGHEVVSNPVAAKPFTPPLETSEGDTGYWTQTDNGPVWTTVAPTPEAVQPAEETPITQADQDDGADPRPAFLRRGEITMDVAFEEVEAAAVAREAAVNKGLAKTKIAAMFDAARFYGDKAKAGVDFECRKTAHGEWYWGPMLVVAAKTPKPSKKAVTKERRAVVKAQKADKTNTGPTGMAIQILKLASRKNGVTPLELNELTTWKGAPWKWLFSNPKGTGYCDRFNYSFEAIKDGRAVSYKVTKNA